MKIPARILCIAVTAGCALSPREGISTNAPCLDKSQLTNQMTPVKLSGSLIACVNNGNFESAMTIYALSGVYGRFDSLRVRDESAHQATGVLRNASMGVMRSDALQRFRTKIAEVSDDDARLRQVCLDVDRIGAPQYFPRYMIDHGMDKLQSPESANLVANFNASTAWKRALNGYLGCPAN